MSIFYSIVTFIFVFFILVFFHELGHFVTAKIFKIKVNEFFLGFGPKIFEKKYNETSYNIRLFPLGGAVALEGEEQTNIYDPNAFSNKPLIIQFLVVFAGPTMNFIVAFVIFVLLGINLGTQGTVITNISENSLAYNNGLKINDKILSINENKINNWYDIIDNIKNNKNLEFMVKRDSDIVKISFLKENDNSPIGINCYSKNINDILVNSANQVINISKQMLNIIPKLFYDNEVQKTVTGPIGIYKIIDKASKTNFIIIMEITAILSINLGIMNFLPIPALDGGRLFFLLISIILKQFNINLNSKYEEIIHKLGFVILMVLTFILIIKDIFNPLEVIF